MAEAPRFPSPEEAKAKRPSVPSAASADVTQPARAVVVQRPDPIPDSTEPAKAPPKFTPEEVRALLAVEGVNRPMTAVWKRGRVLIIPIGLIDLATHFIFGSAAPFVIAALTVAAFVYCALPLLRRDDWS